MTRSYGVPEVPQEAQAQSEGIPASPEKNYRSGGNVEPRNTVVEPKIDVRCRKCGYPSASDGSPGCSCVQAQPEVHDYPDYDPYQHPSKIQDDLDAQVMRRRSFLAHMLGYGNDHMADNGYLSPETGRIVWDSETQARQNGHGQILHD